MFELKRPADDAPTSLRATRGEPAPAGLADDLAALSRLPEPLRAAFWEVLAPYLAGMPSSEQQAHIAQLCAGVDLELEELVAPIRGARFLITAAVRAALDRAAFEEDVRSLVEEERAPVVLDALWPCFERAEPVMAHAIVARTLADHGRLVEDVHWRIDKIINSEHGDGINTPVAVLTFAYRDGSKAERVTLHLLPEQLHKLKLACQQMLPD